MSNALTLQAGALSLAALRRIYEQPTVLHLSAQDRGRIASASALVDKIVAALNALDSEPDGIRDGMEATVARNLQMMARMGTYFEEQVAKRYPEFPIRTGVLGWEKYLPPLSPNLVKLLEAQSGVLAS